VTYRSMDDLPDVEHSFAYCADLAEILMPEPPEIYDRYADSRTFDFLKDARLL
jgi:hypothetical protein